jgi:hypothetical protein
MAMSVPFPIFSGRNEEFGFYIKRLEASFDANNTDESKKVSTLIAVMGQDLYKLAYDLFAPVDVSTQTFDNIVYKLKLYLNPPPKVIPARCKFFKRNQNDIETICIFVACLRGLADNCKFGDNLNTMLRDKIVSGVKSENLQRRLLQESDDVTLDRIYDIATAFELAESDMRIIKSDTKDCDKLYLHTSDNKKCYRCGSKNHMAPICKFKEATCYKCGMVGHISTVCTTNTKTQTKHGNKRSCRNKKVKKQYGIEKLEKESDADFDIQRLSNKHLNDNLHITLEVDGNPIEFEIDTGSAVTVISLNLFEKFWCDKKLVKCFSRLKSFSGNLVDIVGQYSVFVKQAGLKLPIMVVQKNNTALLGRNWLGVLKIDYNRILNIDQLEETTKVVELLEKYPRLFDSKYGVIPDIKGQLYLKEGAVPKCCKARPVPFALRDKVKSELDRLMSEEIITKVNSSNWSTPMVVVHKKNGSVRLCGDFKVTVNPQIRVDQHPIPRIEEIFNSLSGSKYFSKLDICNAFLNLEMEENSKELLTLVTNWGLYRFNRLAFGVASSPAIWQRTIEQILDGIAGTQVYMDDILVMGKTKSEHLENLTRVFKRLDEFNLKLNKEKCKFFKPSLEFCGHIIDANGLHQAPNKIRAIKNAPRPENVSQLRSLIGFINYYHKFLPNLSTILEPWYALLKNGTRWCWSKECDNTFEKVKNLITSNQVLTPYDSDFPIRLACDASSYGLGAVISQMVNGKERPIAFASRTLNNAERNYSQIEKEGLSIVWSIKKFHIYLYGRKFILFTDHKPLTFIFNPSKGISGTMSSRLQRWALLLASFDYDIEYRSSGKHSNADGLSRVPLKETTQEEEDICWGIDLIEYLEDLPVTVQEIRKQTLHDPVLKIVYQNVMKGWLEKMDDRDITKDLLPYFYKRNELTISQGCLMWGLRVLVPYKFRKIVKTELHQGHLGIVKMKALARSFVWWPGIDKEIEELARSCSDCQEYKLIPKNLCVHKWEQAPSPWYRIHIDYAGPFLGKMFLVIVDAYSKWPEIISMNSTNTESTIRVLRDVFSRYGIPVLLVSDNGTQFTSEEFENFLRSNGVKHSTCAPYHPATNGQAERYVQTFKYAMKAALGDSGSLSLKLANFLFAYRNTPHMSTNETPANLFLKRNLRSRLSLVQPQLLNDVMVRGKEHQKCKIFESSKKCISEIIVECEDGYLER